MSTKEERDARIDALVEATNAWADKRKGELEKEATLLKRIQRGRSGSSRLSSKMTTTAAAQMIDEIDDFLTGG
jgi:hypothetical protein